ncbi:hypothetical protein M405DRAFT_129673 [Rhizopogon salebrosus TDB-379]|nr:hypothetical protein M405DRAFT_129673 [Rhizopogon salebrosus TDB-379]
MMPDTYLVVYVIIPCFPLFLAWRSGRAPPPPGPRSLQFVGDAFDVDVPLPWLSYTPYQYHSILSLTSYQVMLCTLVCWDNTSSLSTPCRPGPLDRRSTICSDRPAACRVCVAI